MKVSLFNALFIFNLIFFFSCTEEKKYRDEIYEKPEINPNPEIKYLSPEESLAKMYIPKGYRIELIASEPMINSTLLNLIHLLSARYGVTG